MAVQSALGTPAYRRLADELRRDIREGRFPPERRLPTEAEVTARWQVSRQTARHAFNELVAEGLIYRVRGRGSFAVAGASEGNEKYLRSVGSVDDLLSLSVDTSLEVIEPFRPAVDVAVASRLRLTSDEIAVALMRRLHAGVPFAVTTVHLPPAIAKRVVSDSRLSAGAVSESTVIGLVDAASRSPIAGAHQSITGAAVPIEMSRLLEIEAGTPTIKIDRLYFTAEGEMVELAVSYYNPLRYSYRVQLRRTLS
jgi:GntR family transcriptional regulator